MIMSLMLFYPTNNVFLVALGAPRGISSIRLFGHRISLLSGYLSSHIGGPGVRARWYGYLIATRALLDYHLCLYGPYCLTLSYYQH